MADVVFRKGLGLKADVRGKLIEDFHASGVIRWLRSNGLALERGGLTLRLARELGFCYGVERTVQYAYETLERFPDRPIYITDEVIHNPQVNERLQDLGMRFLKGRYACGKSMDDLSPSDVVLITAFGSTVEEMNRLKARGSVLVDTTCGSVLNVWKNVERYAREGVTAVVHGKIAHEETMATVSQVRKYPGGRYIVVRDLAETDVVAEYIRRGGDREAFLAKFAKAASTPFDPDLDLGRLGLANQTTMLSSESMEVQRRLRQAIVDRHGEAEAARRVIAFDTICSATQDRQDAALEMLNGHALDLAIVVGGYNSSNTGHLAELCAERIPAYHVENETSLVSGVEIDHWAHPAGGVVRTRDWLKAGPVRVGLTWGASTPDNIAGRVIQRLYALRGVSLDDLDAPPAPVQG
ncbi:MAG TPA: 4-hydroxy-3-methylbut-2-enyl diphosphate reductase [Planctomycetota bacterium]